MQIVIPKLGRISLSRAGLIVSRDPGQATLTADLIWATSLKIKHVRNGEEIREYNLGSGLITNAGVNLLAAGSTNLYAFNYHDSGTGTQAPQISDTTLQLPIVGNARVSGYQSTLANVYTTVASITYLSPLVITEWGLFSAATNGTMWDRKTFTGISVLTNDILQITYSVSLMAGG